MDLTGDSCACTTHQAKFGRICLAGLQPVQQMSLATGRPVQICSLVDSSTCSLTHSVTHSLTDSSTCPLSQSVSQSVSKSVSQSVTQHIRCHIVWQLTVSTHNMASVTVAAWWVCCSKYLMLCHAYMGGNIRTALICCIMAIRSCLDDSLKIELCAIP